MIYGNKNVIQGTNVSQYFLYFFPEYKIQVVIVMYETNRIRSESILSGYINPVAPICVRFITFQNHFRRAWDGEK